jgi:site-specific recombinase XerD
MKPVFASNAMHNRRCARRDRTLIGPWIRRFLLEHLVTDRNLTRNTQVSYRDTLVLLLPFVSQAQKKPTDRLMIDDLSPFRLRSFLEYLEKERGSAALRAIYVSPRSTHSRSSSVGAARNM